MKETIGLNGIIIYGADDALSVEFYSRPVEKQVTGPDGRTVFIETENFEEMVRIKIDAFNTQDFPVDEVFKVRFARQYAAWKDGTETGGTKLDEWTEFPKERLHHYLYMGVKYVEQLAASGDAMLSSLGIGSRDLHYKARAFLSGKVIEDAKSEDTIEKNALRKQIEELRSQMQSLLHMKMSKSKKHETNAVVVE